MSNIVCNACINLATWYLPDTYIPETSTLVAWCSECCGCRIKYCDQCVQARVGWTEWVGENKFDYYRDVCIGHAVTPYAPDTVNAINITINTPYVFISDSPPT